MAANTQALEKTALRRRIQAEIAALPESYITESDAGIFKNLTALKEFTQARTLFMYYSVGREPYTVRIAEAALNAGKTVAFPYCYKGGIMEARKINRLDELIPAMLGIPAPTDNAPIIAPDLLDFIIVPALAYDKSGFRLGYGGGYYDRFLSGVPVFKAGITRERLIRDKLPRASHDIAVDCIVTEIRAEKPPVP